MKHPIRKIALTLLLLLIAAVVVGYWMVRSTPAWYRPQDLTPDQSAVAANEVQQKIAAVETWAAAVQARRVRLLQGGSAADNPPIGPTTFTCSENQINGWAQSWTGDFLHSAEDHLRADRPYIALSDGALIAGATSRDFGAVLSGQCAPSITSDGKLLLDWGNFRVGQFPAPQSLVSPLVDSARSNLLSGAAPPTGGQIDPDGSGDAPAMETILYRIVQNTLDHKPCDPNFFIPSNFQDHRGASVRITAIHIGDGSLSMTLEPDDADPATIQSRLVTAP